MATSYRKGFLWTAASLINGGCRAALEAEIAAGDARAARRAAVKQAEAELRAGPR